MTDPLSSNRCAVEQTSILDFVISQDAKSKYSSDLLKRFITKGGKSVKQNVKFFHWMKELIIIAAIRGSYDIDLVAGCRAFALCRWATKSPH